MVIRKEGLITSEVKEYPVFIASDISNPPQSVVEIYKSLRDASTRAGFAAFLPLDFVGAHLGDVPEQEAAQIVLANLNLAQLTVFYVGFPSLDAGMMLGRAKQMGKPLILLYEATKERELREKDPKIWWRPRGPHDAPFRGGIVTATSYASFLVPESLDPSIIKEIKFQTREEACSSLEKEIRKFFHC